MITIINYGLGNVGSIQNILNRMRVPCRLGSSREDIIDADKLILPGVGSFDKGMHLLRERELVKPLEMAILDNRIPILGICLGLQLFLEGSDEGKMPGLGWIEGRAVRFKINKGDLPLRVPHMGWNSIKNCRQNPLLTGLDDRDRFYFVHSFHASRLAEEVTVGQTTYKYDFPSVIAQDNIVGIQCHPERSHQSGVKILNNFIKM